MEYLTICLTTAWISVFVLATGHFSATSHLAYLSKYLHLRYDILDNVTPKSGHTARVTLMNKGSNAIRLGDWAIFFCNIRMIYPSRLPKSGSVEIDRTGIKISHINGCLFKMEPTPTFKPLLPKKQLIIPLNVSWYEIARTDVMPNWYVAPRSKGGPAKAILNTATEELDFVGPFDSSKKWKRGKADKFNPYTPAQRYDLYDIRDFGKPAKLVIPTPKSVKLDINGHYITKLTGDWVVVASRTLQKEAEYLSNKLGLVSTNTSQTDQFISLNTGNVTSDKIAPDLRKESYKLDIDADHNIIRIVGQTSTGVFYGIQTLISLLEGGQPIPGGTIVDYPRFAYRGMHVDVARNFHPKRTIFKLLDAMAMYKLNKLHFHLTDDEGWRLEIPGLDELTQIGGRRCHDLEEATCLLPQLGSSPVTGSQGSGYYSVQAYKEILQYAKERHIEVIPEFDMPGHGHAAIKAMEARYKKINALGNLPEATSKLLSDQGDRSEYLSVQMFTDNAINPCVGSTYSFIKHVVQAIVDIHQGVQPLQNFHFGGDEVAKSAWDKSPLCAKFMAEAKLNNTKEVKEYFVTKVSEITEKFDLSLAAWEDGVLGEGGVPFSLARVRDKNTYAYAWQNIWEWGAGQRAYVLANAGYKVVLAGATHLYFDHPYEPDPEERGYYWATRYTDTQKVFGFMPDSLYQNIDISNMGDQLNKASICGPGNEKCPELRNKTNIVGMQGHLWTETVRTEDQFDYMIFPRLLALAERSWHNAPWENVTSKARRAHQKQADWQDFANTLGYKELKRLDDIRVNYRIPVPGVKVYSDGRVVANTNFPGLKIHYSTDNGLSWSGYKPGLKFHKPTRVHFITRSADLRRASRSVTVQVKPQSGFSGTGGQFKIEPSFMLLKVALLTFLGCMWP